MNIIFATGNKHKLQEAQQILGPEFTLRTSAESGITEDIPETSHTLKGNAIQKAMYIWDRLHTNCFADDTGLEIDALNGAPGVYSARYAGEKCSFQDNIVKVLKELEGVPAPRTARFRCVVALVVDGQITTFDGIVEGEITLEPRGNGGFGYDPIFKPQGYDRCFSELSADEKNSISHRGMAMKLLSEHLKTIK
ncbi:MAG: RdgB/HAM1 family non-canonical purine NTP pyrophosphatase [Bacteroidales bacterium]|nr:RdgB/HAM1 family non-canonical purine NTP pyrophosphatase [Bacteroidales bacterium]